MQPRDAGAISAPGQGRGRIDRGSRHEGCKGNAGGRLLKFGPAEGPEGATLQGSLEEQTAAIKARYQIGNSGPRSGQFCLVLVQPSPYDRDGYVIQWLRPGAASPALQAVEELALGCQRDQVLGDGVAMEVRAIDERSTRLQMERLVRELEGGRGMVFLTGVQTSEFPRAMDLALPLRAAGVPVCMSGRHVRESLKRMRAVSRELQEAMNVGIALLAGEPEEQLAAVVRDAWERQLKPLYPALPQEGAAAESFWAAVARGNRLDGGLPWPFQGRVRTLLAEAGTGTSSAAMDGLGPTIRRGLADGVERFLLAEDDFSRRSDWEPVFDRLIALREREKVPLELMLCADAMCHRVRGFIEKAGRAGVRRVLMDLESIDPESTLRAQHRVGEYRRMLAAWKRAGAMVFVRSAAGEAGATRERMLREIGSLQRELAIDLLDPVDRMVGRPGERPESQEAVDADAWKAFYSVEHMETVLRRAAAAGLDTQSLMRLLLRFHSCIVYERVDPRQGGYGRRRHRRDRRPTLARESPLRFYGQSVREAVTRQAKMAQLEWRFRRFVREMERDPQTKHYSDAALPLSAGTENGVVTMPLRPAAVAR